MPRKKYRSKPIFCEHCGRTFTSQEPFDLHKNRLTGKCRTPVELTAAGLVYTPNTDRWRVAPHWIA